MTAVGGTVNIPEVAVYFSGGGFSNYFPLPSYQADAVLAWFQKHSPDLGPNVYNESRRSRGYPDVAANGVNYTVAIGPNPIFDTPAFMTEDGTSASVRPSLFTSPSTS